MVWNEGRDIGIWLRAAPVSPWRNFSRPSGHVGGKKVRIRAQMTDTIAHVSAFYYGSAGQRSGRFEPPSTRCKGATLNWRCSESVPIPLALRNENY